MSRKLMPTISILLLIAMLVLVGTNGATIAARAEGERQLPIEDSVPFSLSSKSALLMEASTGRVIFEKAADERRPVAIVEVQPRDLTRVFGRDALQLGERA